MRRLVWTSCLENTEGRNQAGMFPLLVRQGLASKQLVKLYSIIWWESNIRVFLQAKWAHEEDSQA